MRERSAGGERSGVYGEMVCMVCVVNVPFMFIIKRQQRYCKEVVLIVKESF